MIQDQVSQLRIWDPEFGSNWDSLRATYPADSIAKFMKRHHLKLHQIGPLVDEYFNFRGNMFGEPVERMFLDILFVSIDSNQSNSKQY